MVCGADGFQNSVSHRRVLEERGVVEGRKLSSINWGSATRFRPFLPTHKYYQWISIVQTLLLDFQEMVKPWWLPYNLDLYDNLKIKWMRATWHFHGFIDKIFMEALGLKMGLFSFTWQLSLLAIRNIITATRYRIKSQFATTEFLWCRRLGWTNDIRVTVTLVCKGKTRPGSFTSWITCCKSRHKSKSKRWQL